MDQTDTHASPRPDATALDTPAKTRVLSALTAAEPLTAIEIAERTGLSTAWVRRLAHALETEGLVARAPRAGLTGRPADEFRLARRRSVSADPTPMRGTRTSGTATSGPSASRVMTVLASGPLAPTLIATRTGMSPSTVRAVLRELNRNGLAEPTPGHTVSGRRGRLPREWRLTDAAATAASSQGKNPRFEQSVLAALAYAGRGLFVDEVAARTGLPPISAHAYLSALATGGLVEILDRGQRYDPRFGVTDAGRAAVALDPDLVAATQYPHEYGLVLASLGDGSSHWSVSALKERTGLRPLVVVAVLDELVRIGWVKPTHTNADYRKCRYMLTSVANREHAILSARKLTFLHELVLKVLLQAHRWLGGPEIADAAHMSVSEASVQCNELLAVALITRSGRGVRGDQYRWSLTDLGEGVASGRSRVDLATWSSLSVAHVCVNFVGPVGAAALGNWRPAEQSANPLPTGPRVRDTKGGAAWTAVAMLGQDDGGSLPAKEMRLATHTLFWRASWMRSWPRFVLASCFPGTSCQLPSLPVDCR
jgi:DNA-binding IclR family transcriptional regulator